MKNKMFMLFLLGTSCLADESFAKIGIPTYSLFGQNLPNVSPLRRLAASVKQPPLFSLRKTSILEGNKKFFILKPKKTMGLTKSLSVPALKRSIGFSKTVSGLGLQKSMGFTKNVSRLGLKSSVRPVSRSFIAPKASQPFVPITKIRSLLAFNKTPATPLRFSKGALQVSPVVKSQLQTPLGAVLAALKIPTKVTGSLSQTLKSIVVETVERTRQREQEQICLKEQIRQREQEQLNFQEEQRRQQEQLKLQEEQRCQKEQLKLQEEQRRQQEQLKLQEEQRRQQEQLKLQEAQRRQQEQLKLQEEQRRQQEQLKLQEEQRRQQEQLKLQEEQRCQQERKQQELKEEVRKKEEALASEKQKQLKEAYTKLIAEQKEKEEAAKKLRKDQKSQQKKNVKKSVDPKLEAERNLKKEQDEEYAEASRQDRKNQVEADIQALEADIKELEAKIAEIEKKPELVRLARLANLKDKKAEQELLAKKKDLKLPELEKDLEKLKEKLKELDKPVVVQQKVSKKEEPVDEKTRLQRRLQELAAQKTKLLENDDLKKLMERFEATDKTMLPEKQPRVLEKQKELGLPKVAEEIQELTAQLDLLTKTDPKVEKRARLAKILNPNPSAQAQDFANALKELNPNMVDELASAWANWNIPYITAVMGDQYSDEQLTYTFQQGGANPLTLYRHIMPGYRLGCGYYSLGLNHTEARAQLLAEVAQGRPNAQRYKEMFAEEIFEAVIYDNLPESLKTEESRQLRAGLNAAETSINDWTRPLNAHLNAGHSYSADELNDQLFQDFGFDLFTPIPEDRQGRTVFDLLVGLDLAKEELKTKTTAIKTWAKQNQVVESYINAEIIPGKELTFLRKGFGGQDRSGVIDILAEINGFSLNIYVPMRGNPQQLDLAHAYVTPNAVRQANLLYVPGHFDRLEANLHRHVTPEMEYQDPFAAYKTEAVADEETIEAIGQEMKNLDKAAEKVLFPEGEALEQELFNLEGYGENKQAWIKDYMAQEQVEGREVSEQQATEEYTRIYGRTMKEVQIENYMAQAQSERREISEQQATEKYTKRKTDLEFQIKKGKEACASQKTPTTPLNLTQYLMDASQKATIIVYKDGGKELQREAQINPAMIGSALEAMYLDGFPTVIYPEGFKTCHQYMIDATINAAWEKGYTFFYLTDEGLFGKKTENDNDDFEKFLTFDGRKVEFPRNPQDDEGIARFYTRTPDPKEASIYDEMVKDAQQILKNSGEAVTYIKDAKLLFLKRKDLLAKAAKGEKLEMQLQSKIAKKPSEDLGTTKHMFHFERYDKKNDSSCYDGIAPDQGLNHIHNALTQPYLMAKKRGAKNLEYFFTYAMSSEKLAHCMDATSMSFHKYAALQEKGLDTDEVGKKTKKEVIQRELAELAKGEPTEESIRARLMEFVGVGTLDGEFQRDDVTKAIQSAKDLGLIN